MADRAHERRIDRQDPARCFADAIAGELALLPDHQLRRAVAQLPERPDDASEANTLPRAKPSSDYTRQAAIAAVTDALQGLAGAALARWWWQQDAPRVAVVAREISQIEDALRTTSDPPACLRPETWRVLFAGDFTATGIIRAVTVDGAGALQRGRMWGTIGCGNAWPEFGPFGDQMVWADHAAGSVGDLGIAMRRAANDPKDVTAFAIERRPDVGRAVKLWLERACGTLVTDDIRLSTAVAAAKRDGVAELLAEGLAVLRQALLRRASGREEPQGIGPKQIFAELPPHAFWLARCGTALLWPDAGHYPTRQQLNAMARIMLETDLLFREAIDEGAPEPPPFNSALVAWIMNQRCTAASLQTAIEELRSKSEKSRRSAAARVRQTAARL